ncbi:MAG: hypothetical protein KGO49_11860 [Gammaproteobacteria bacterium]|nr:hypothetical protein [Gammaproteobacteria bacterium]
MLKIVCLDDKYLDFLNDYWNVDDNYKLTYSDTYLYKKHSIKTINTLNITSKKAGYAILNNEKFLCPSCNLEHQLTKRKYLNKILENNFSCHNCFVKQMDTEINTDYDYYSYHLNFFSTIYNQNKIKSNPTNFNELLDSLNFLELIYLNIIYNNLKPNIYGVIGKRKCALFLYQEFYVSNKAIISLNRKKIFYYLIENNLNGLSVHLEASRFNYRKILPPTTLLKLKDLRPKYRDISPIISKPFGEKIVNLNLAIMEKINNYEFSLFDIEMISEHLTETRNSEISFLFKVVKHCDKFKLKSSNSVDAKKDTLKEQLNLKQIYGYINRCVFSTLYFLDYLNDYNRIRLKNCIFTNIVKSNKNSKVIEKELPPNYRKSNFISFLENKYELSCHWEEVTVNEFIKALFEKLNLKNVN